MTATLRTLLARLEQIPEDVERRVDHGFNTFPDAPVVITDWNYYEATLAAFFAHVECVVLGIQRREVNPTFDWGRCRQLLVKEWGENGYKAGFELARTGNEGGMLKVFRTVARLMAKECAKGQIAALAHSYWQRQSAEQLLADAESYVEAYGHLLPSETTERSAARIKAEFLKVLKEHPFTVRRMQQVGR